MRNRAQFRYNKKPHAIFDVYTNKNPLEKSKTTDISLANLSAISAIKVGKGVEDHLHTLAYSVNICLVMSEIGYGVEFTDSIRASQHAVIRTIERFKSTGKVGFSGDDIRMIQPILGLLDEQILVAPKAEVQKAACEVRRRLDRGDIL